MRDPDAPDPDCPDCEEHPPLVYEGSVRAEGFGDRVTRENGVMFHYFKCAICGRKYRVWARRSESDPFAARKCRSRLPKLNLWEVHLDVRKTSTIGKPGRTSQRTTCAIGALRISGALSRVCPNVFRRELVTATTTVSLNKTCGSKDRAPEGRSGALS